MAARRVRSVFLRRLTQRAHRVLIQAGTRRARQYAAVLLATTLVVSGLPLQMVSYLTNGRWSSAPTLALAANTPTLSVIGAAQTGAGSGTFFTVAFDNTTPVGTVVLVMISGFTPSPAQSIVSVTDAQSGATYEPIVTARDGNLIVSAFWHRLQVGDAFLYHVNLAIPAESGPPSAGVSADVDTWKVQNASATSPFDFATVSSYQTPNSTSVSQPNYAPTTDGELIISLAAFNAPTNTRLGVPSGTNPTFTNLDDFYGGTAVGIDVNTADGTGTAPIGARTFTASAAVAEAMVVLFAATNADTEVGATAPYAYGNYEDGAYTDADINVATGVYTTSTTDLAMPGRVLGFEFTRTYNSADTTTGPLGPAWTHSYNWKLTDATSMVTIRRGDGRRDTFTRNADSTFRAPPDVFDRLVKNGDSTFTLTLKNQVQYEFTTAGLLSRIHEPAGNQVSLTYTSGKLTTITDTVGRAVTLSYDGSNRLTQVQDPLGRKTTYAYDASGRLATVTDKIGNATGQNPALHRWQYGYSGTTQHLTTITDPDGRVRITNTYDISGRVYQQRDGLNRLATVTYDPDSTTTVDYRGNSSTQTYDSRRRARVEARQVSGQILTLSKAYDAAGNLTSVTDRNGQTTDYTYDSNGNVLTKTDPQIDPQTPRYLTTFVYDSKNNLTQVTDPRQFITTMTYDPTTNVRLSVTRQIDATTNATTKYEYADVVNKGMPTRVITPRGNLSGTPDYTYATTLTYDSQGKLTTQIDADGAKTTFGYDAVGRRTSRVDPDGYGAGASVADHTWTTTYDENDQVKAETDPLGASVTYTYDGAGNRATLTDRNGNVTTYSYDLNARLATVLQKPDPVGNPTLTYTTQISRDNNGNASHVTQANGAVTDYGYDELDRLTSTATHPDPVTTLTTMLTLDGNGNVLTRTTPAPESQLTTNTYDALSRLSTVSAAGLATVTYQYDGASNRVQVTDGTGVSTYQYDGLGRLTQAAQPNGSTTYGYDRDGNRVTLTYPGGADTITYTFTAGGRLDHVVDAAARTSTYSYMPSGLAKTLTAPDGLMTTYGYDRAQRLTSVANLVAANVRTRHSYTLDREGNRVALDEFVEGITAAPSTTWATSVKVNTDVGTTVQDHPAIALARDGGQYLIWDDARDGNTNIYFSWRDPSTGMWTDPNIKLNSDTGTRAHLNPAISVDAVGNAYAVWEDSRDGASNKIDTNIYGAKRTGSTWGANSKVNTDTTGNPVQRNPRIGGTSSGVQTAVWVDLRSNQNNIYSAQLPSGAATWPTTANLRVTDNTAAVKDFPDVAVGTDGTSYAVWQDSRNGNADIFFAKLPAGASAWTANVKISDDPGTFIQRLARIGVDASGNLIAVWLDDRTTPSKIRMSTLPSGSSTWTASSIVTDAAARPLSVALSVRADGKAYVTFHDNRSSSTDVYGTEYDPWLNAWSISTLVSDDAGAFAQQSPTVAYGVNEIAAAWRDDRSGNADVRARRATLTGTDHSTFTYDGLERLTVVAGVNPETFILDAASNVSARTGPSATNSYDTANRQTSDGTQTFTWTPSDRLAGRGADSFTFDALDRMSGATISGTARAYTYNADGLMQSRTDSSTTTFLWDAGSSPSRLLQVGADRIVYGLGPIYAVRAGGSTVTFARDGLKSTRAELDDSGMRTASFRYRVYGEVAQSSLATVPSYLGYASQLFDPSGLYYMRARWYDPATGRFVSRDPATPSWSQPRTLNSYGYAYANPAIVTDPTGLWGGVDDLVALAGGAIIGGGISIVTQQIAHPGTIDWGKVGVGALSGAVAAEVSLYAGPLAGGAAGGFVGDFASQVHTNRGFNNFNVGELAFATTTGAATGWAFGQVGLAGPTARGATASRGNSLVGTRSALFGSSKPRGMLNDNDFLRVGWGWNPAGNQVFRIAIGNPRGPIHIHIDFWR